MTATRGRAASSLLAATAVVCCVVAVVLWRQQAVTPAGAICGSVWHWRPGHGEPGGGLLDPDAAAAGVQRCREAAAGPFAAGLVLLGLAAATSVAALVLVRRRGPAPAQSRSGRP